MGHPKNQSSPALIAKPSLKNLVSNALQSEAHNPLHVNDQQRAKSNSDSGAVLSMEQKRKQSVATPDELDAFEEKKSRVKNNFGEMRLGVMSWSAIKEADKSEV